ncbi:MAG: magnesium transporter [Patescibacteria group bacterium]
MMSINISRLHKSWIRRLKTALFGDGDGLLMELLSKVGDDELVHTVDQLSVKNKLQILRVLPVKRRINVLLDMSDWSFESVLPRLQFEEIWAIVQAAESDDAADIIQWLNPTMRDKVTARLTKEGDLHGLLPLLVFDGRTAGGLMKTEILKFHDIRTVAEARQAITADDDARYKSNYVYVLNANEELVGRISLVKLIQADANSQLQAIMNREITTLSSSQNQEDVAILFDEQSAIELPVVGHRNQLLGVITADDIFSVMEEEHFEDVSHMAGVNENAHISDPIWLSSRRRLPWLGINLVTALMAAGVVSLFRGTIQEMVILAAFMPVVASMGGNAAQQSLAITIRSMAVGEFRHLQILHVVAKETSVGMMNGFLTGVAVGFLASLWTGDWEFGAVLVISMTLNLLAAGFSGVAVPLIMRAVKVDPALSSTIFVTATTDIVGFTVFLGLATLML